MNVYNSYIDKTTFIIVNILVDRRLSLLLWVTKLELYLNKKSNKMFNVS